MTRRRFAILPVALVAAYWLALAAWLSGPALARAALAWVDLQMCHVGGLK